MLFFFLCCSLAHVKLEYVTCLLLYFMFLHLASSSIYMKTFTKQKKNEKHNFFFQKKRTKCKSDTMLTLDDVKSKRHSFLLGEFMTRNRMKQWEKKRTKIKRVHCTNTQQRMDWREKETTVKKNVQTKFKSWNVLGCHFVFMNWLDARRYQSMWKAMVWEFFYIWAISFTLIRKLNEQKRLQHLFGQCLISNEHEVFHLCISIRN